MKPNISKIAETSKIEYHVEVNPTGNYVQEILELTTPSGEVFQIEESEQPYCVDFIQNGEIVHYGVDFPETFMVEQLGVAMWQAATIWQVINRILMVY